MSDLHGRQALAQIDHVLAHQPAADGERLSAATRALAACRDALIAQARTNGADALQRHRLARLNAVITIVLAATYPLGEIPWPELRDARAWLADALDPAVA